MKKRTILTISLTKKLVPILIVVLSFSSCKKKNVENGPLYNMDYKEAIVESRNNLRTLLMTSSTPGLSVTVSLDGELIWSEGLGYANKELKAPATRDTKFRIGHTSQLFTGYLIAKLQEEGKLNVDSSFYAYIPDFPGKDFDFTLRMLGANTAGFPESNRNELLKQDEDIRTLKDYVKKHKDDPFVYEPDSYYYRSNYSWALLGILAEEVTKERFSKLVHSIVLDTLDIENTLIDNNLAIIDNRSANYNRDYIARLVNAPEVNLAPFAPALGFLSTAEDLNIAAQQILEPGFLSQESIDLMTQPHTLKSGQQLNSGFGWLVTVDQNGRRIFGQVGNTVGGSSAIAVYPEEKLVVTICSNLGDDLEELPVLKIGNNFMNLIDPIEKNE